MLKFIFLGVKIVSNQFLLMLGYALYICMMNVNDNNYILSLCDKM